MKLYKKLMVEDSHLKDHLERTVAEGSNNACTILITCEKAAHNGKMQVEMSFDGDSDLAALLIDNAQTYLEQEAFPEQSC